MLSCLKNIENFSSAKKILEDQNLVVKEYKDLGLYLVKYNKNDKPVHSWAECMEGYFKIIEGIK